MKPVLTLFFLFVLCGAILYVSTPISTYLGLSMLFAYLLDPLASWLHSKGISRTITAGALIALLILTLATAALQLSPLIYTQANDFINSIPQYQDYVTQTLVPLLTKKLEQYDLLQLASKSLGSLASHALALLGRITEQLWNSWSVLIDAAVGFALVPLTSFYLLKNWHQIMNAIERLIPSRDRPGYISLFKDIDASLSAFIRGQLYCCLSAALYYSVALSLIGVDFGLFIGLLIGLFGFVPFFSAVGLIASLVSHYVEAHTFSGAMPIFLVFAIGAALENTLNWVLMSKQVGLPFVVTVFTLMLGSKMFGFKGLFISIPLAASLAILFKHFIAALHAPPKSRRKDQRNL